MDSSRFDRLAQAWSAARTRRTLLPALGGALIAPVATSPGVDATIRKRRKHNRKCANKCKNGCCPSKYGKCVRPQQQTAELCGTGGERCRRTGCTSPETCADHTCNATTPCPTGECCSAEGTCCACLAFVTSTTHDGNLGGLTGADAICQARAAAGGLPGADEPGAYKAWLSDTTGSPVTRFRCTGASCSGQGYQRVDETPIASDWDALTDGGLAFAISVTELNTFVRRADSTVWTNTTITGTEGPFPSSCVGSTWSSPSSIGDTGIATAFDATWTDTGGGIGCGAEVHLYCFQQS
jgi:hypothetical protein